MSKQDHIKAQYLSAAGLMLYFAKKLLKTNEYFIHTHVLSTIDHARLRNQATFIWVRFHHTSGCAEEVTYTQTTRGPPLAGSPSTDSPWPNIGTVLSSFRDMSTAVTSDAYIVIGAHILIFALGVRRHLTRSTQYHAHFFVFWMAFRKINDADWFWKQKMLKISSILSWPQTRRNIFNRYFKMRLLFQGRLINI